MAIRFSIQRSGNLRKAPVQRHTIKHVRSTCQCAKNVVFLRKQNEFYGMKSLGQLEGKEHDLLTIPTSDFTSEELSILDGLINEWQLGEVFHYRVEEAAEGPTPTVTFYVPRKNLPNFIYAMFSFGHESVHRLK